MADGRYHDAKRMKYGEGGLPSMGDTWGRAYLGQGSRMGDRTPQEYARAWDGGGGEHAYWQPSGGNPPSQDHMWESSRPRYRPFSLQGVAEPYFQGRQDRDFERDYDRDRYRDRLSDRDWVNGASQNSERSGMLWKDGGSRGGAWESERSGMLWKDEGSRGGAWESEGREPKYIPGFTPHVQPGGPRSQSAVAPSQQKRKRSGRQPGPQPERRPQAQQAQSQAQAQSLRQLLQQQQQGQEQAESQVQLTQEPQQAQRQVQIPQQRTSKNLDVTGKSYVSVAFEWAQKHKIPLSFVCITKDPVQQQFVYAIMCGEEQYPAGGGSTIKEAKKEAAIKFLDRVLPAEGKVSSNDLPKKTSEVAPKAVVNDIPASIPEAKKKGKEVKEVKEGNKVKRVKENKEVTEKKQKKEEKDAVQLNYAYQLSQLVLHHPDYSTYGTFTYQVKDATTIASLKLGDLAATGEGIGKKAAKLATAKAMIWKLLLGVRDETLESRIEELRVAAQKKAQAEKEAKQERAKQEGKKKGTKGSNSTSASEKPREEAAPEPEVQMSERMRRQLERNSPPAEGSVQEVEVGLEKGVAEGAAEGGHGAKLLDYEKYTGANVSGYVLENK